MWGAITKLWQTSQIRNNLRPSSPEMPGQLTKLGRLFYSISVTWLTVVWYTAYVNQRTEPGSGPSLVLPGSKKPQYPPDRADRSPFFAQGSSSSSSSAPGQSAGLPGKSGKSGPFPGAVGSRLDQGFDLTSTIFQAPDRSRILFASASVSGWQGGGLVAGLLLSGPRKGKVWYMAEGLKPLVTVGQVVEQNTEVAAPAKNPYNGIMGNIEAGWANPQSPTQPLAQVSASPPSVAWDFYNYVRTLGAPTASQTGQAGYP